MARRSRSSQSPRVGNRPAALQKAVPPAWRRALIRRLFWVAGGALGLLAALLFWFAREAAVIDISQLNQVPERTQVIDCRHRLVGVLHGENRIFIPVSEVPIAFKNALLAREDNRFYDHGGVDWLGVLRAAFRNVKEGEVVQGASTLTMQLSRNRFDLSGRSLHRKMVEAMLSRRLEKQYSKDQLFEAYLNIVYFGAGQYGLEQASRAYFEKQARDLTLSEAAMLAGIIRGPNKFSPFKNPRGACAEMNVVLDRMVETGRLTAEIAAEAKANPPVIRPPGRRAMADSWAMDLTRRELDLILDDHNIAEGGLRVYTTLDVDLQKAAEDALEAHLSAFEAQPGYRYPTRAQQARRQAALPAGSEPEEPLYLQGSVVVLDNGTGGIRAVVGGRSVKESHFNRAMQAKRQVGSLFKPFVYAAAFEAGLSPGAMIDDGPLLPGEITGAPRRWQPHNSDGTYRGMQPLAQGLIRSRNTMSVRVGNYAGLERVRGMADRTGISSGLPRYPAVYLGAFESTLRDMVSAYSCFANRGARSRPFLISEIQDRFGRRVYLSSRAATQGVAKTAAVQTSRILEQVVQSGGTGAAAGSLGVDFPCAGKTGTTDNYRDAWFVGYSGTLSAGVWVGFDQDDRGLAQGYGAKLALPVWAKVMVAAKQTGYQCGRLP